LLFYFDVVSRSCFAYTVVDNDVEIVQNCGKDVFQNMGFLN